MQVRKQQIKLDMEQQTGSKYRSVGLRAPRAGDTEPGTAGPGARAARGLAQGQRRRPRAWLGGREGLRKVSLQPGESGRCAVRCARGSGACGAGSGAGEGARRLEEVCVRAEPGWTLAPPSGVCGGGGAGGGVWRGGGRGSGGGGGSRKVGKSWRARGSALTARAEGSGVRSGLGETQGEGWPPKSIELEAFILTVFRNRNGVFTGSSGFTLHPAPTCCLA